MNARYSNFAHVVAPFHLIVDVAYCLENQRVPTSADKQSASLDT